MIIQTIGVTVGYTHNLGDYSNVRPEIHLTASVLPTESIEECAEQLRDLALSQCYELIDKALEDREEPARFFEGPRFNAYVFPDERVCLIIPANTKAPCLGHATRTYFDHRFDAIHRLLSKKLPDYDICLRVPEGEAEITEHPYIDIMLPQDGARYLLIGMESAQHVEWVQAIWNHQRWRYMSAEKFRQWTCIHAIETGARVINLAQDAWSGEDAEAIRALHDLYSKQTSHDESSDDDDDDDTPFDDDDE